MSTTLRITKTSCGKKLYILYTENARDSDCKLDAVSTAREATPISNAVRVDIEALLANMRKSGLNIPRKPASDEKETKATKTRRCIKLRGYTRVVTLLHVVLLETIHLGLAAKRPTKTLPATNTKTKPDCQTDQLTPLAGDLEAKIISLLKEASDLARNKLSLRINLTRNLQKSSAECPGTREVRSLLKIGLLIPAVLHQ
jgi:hypothetical protein